ncbi:hypothetical protein DT075_04965 [Bacillus licheniformis]|nr:hypothetical protein DT075_04965 [Bacillus licheniformis]
MLFSEQHRRQKYEQSPLAATEYFYQLSKNSNYIQTKRIEKNISYQMDTPYGTMDITINLSKPEKDPEQIKRERAVLLGLESFPEEATAASGDSIPDLLEKLAAYAVEHGVITDDLDAKDMLAANVMNCFVARPSVINAVFLGLEAFAHICSKDY